MVKATKTASGSWKCRVQVAYDGQKQKYKYFIGKTKKEAERLASEYEIEMAQNQDKGCDMLFRQAMEQYITERSEILSPASIKKYRVTQRVLHDLDNYRLDELTQDVLQAYCNKLAAKYTPKTVKDRISTVKAVINRFMPHAVVRVKLPEKRPSAAHLPTDEEIRRIFEASKGTVMELPIALGAICMMRRSEISALLPSDIDDNNVLHICKAVVTDDDNNLVTKAPKTFASDRYISVPSTVGDKIRHLPPEGIGLTPQAITSRFKRLLEREKIPHCRFHDLRHYGASIRHSMGIPDAVTQMEGGWSNMATLQQIYRHAFADDFKSANEKIEGKFKDML